MEKDIKMALHSAVPMSVELEHLEDCVAEVPRAMP